MTIEELAMIDPDLARDEADPAAFLDLHRTRRALEARIFNETDEEERDALYDQLAATL